MIQRIQSIYLLLGAVAAALLFLFDAVLGGPAAAAQPWFGPAVVVLVGLIALLSVFAIFRYKNRQQQHQLTGVLQILTIVLLLVLVTGFYLGGALDEAGPQAIPVNMILAVALPAVAYFFFFFARRAINRDIALIRSMDRLR